MKKNKTQKLAGFTFMELIMVVAIIAIMTVVSFATLNSSKSDAALRSAQREVASAIRLAQSYALQGKWPTGATSVCGYGVRFETVTQYLLFYYSKDTKGVCEINNQTILETQYLQGGVSLVPGSTLVYFTIPSGTATISNGTLAFTVSGKTKTITINPNGSITEN